MAYRPVVLVIRDGWGENWDASLDKWNAVQLAQTPCDDELCKWPRTQIATCGKDVGLPDGVMGNSEVGHHNIGAGRIVEQEITRIDRHLDASSMLQHPVLAELWSRQVVHIIGLMSDGGVHADIRHTLKIMELAKAAGMRSLYLHVILDGRDTPPKSGLGFIRQLEDHCAQLGLGQIVTLMGRYYAMDRDERWERTKRAYDCLTTAAGGVHSEPIAALQAYYDAPVDASRVGDEFVPPVRLRPEGVIQPGHGVLFMNFRGDRTRQLTRAFVEPHFRGFERSYLEDLAFVCLTEYQAGLCPRVLFPKPPKMVDCLGAYLAKKEIPQVRIAETEKYPHVTFFFNDYREEPFELEDRILIPSVRDVPTYDLKPAMSAKEITDAAIQAIESGKYGFVLINYANADMVGHTGKLEAAIQAVETVDAQVARILKAVDVVQGRAIITADHGNAEIMYDTETQQPHTRHTLNPVSVTLYGRDCQGLTLRSGGRLGDLAPTVLKLMDLEVPTAMEGRALY